MSNRKSTLGHSVCSRAPRCGVGSTAQPSQLSTPSIIPATSTTSLAPVPTPSPSPTPTDPEVIVSPDPEMVPQTDNNNENIDPTTVREVDAATHIVVEHLKSGTVQTHVFASKDGKPSLLGHTIPDTTSKTFATVLDNRLQELSTLAQDTLEASRRESFDRLEDLKLTIQENDGLMASQVAQVEIQIRTEVGPKLDRIEHLLLSRPPKSKTPRSLSMKSVSIRSIADGDPEEPEYSRTSLDPMDLTSTDEIGDIGSVSRALGQKGGSSANITNADSSTSSKAQADLVVLEKLSNIETQVDALCKVVIDGQLPLVTDPAVILSSGNGVEIGTAATTSSTIRMNQVGSETMTRFGAMRNELLTFPDMLKSTQTTMQELIETFAKNHTNSEPTNAELVPEADTQPLHHDEHGQWQANVLKMATSHQAGLDDLGIQFQVMESTIQSVDNEIKDWRNSNRLSLRVILKYMYWIYKHTEKVDIKIRQVFDEIKSQIKVEPEQRVQFSGDLDQMRTEIQAVLTGLPEMVADLLKQASTPTIAAGGSAISARPSASTEPALTAAPEHQVEQTDNASRIGEAASFQPNPQSGLDYLAATRPEGNLAPTAKSGGWDSVGSATYSAYNEAWNPGLTISEAAAPVVPPRADKDNVAGAVSSAERADAENRAPTAAAVDGDITIVTGGNGQSNPTLRLIQAVEDLQASAQYMISKYGDLLRSKTIQPTEASSVGEPVATNVTSAPGGTTTDTSPPEAFDTSELLSHEESLERRTRAVEGHSIWQGSSNPSEKQAGNSGPRGTKASPAPGYRRVSPATLSGDPAHDNSTNAGGVAATYTVDTRTPIDRSEILESIGRDGSDTSEPAPLFGMHRELHDELESMNRNMTELLMVITNTTSSLSQGQIHLEEAFRRELNRVLPVMRPAESEGSRARAEAERREAYDRISMIPNLMTSLESVNFHHSCKLDDAQKEIEEIKALIVTLETKIINCHADVQSILHGSMEDSSTLALVKQQIETIISDQGPSSGMFVKSQTPEVMQAAASITELMAINERTLSYQEAQGKLLQDLQTKHREGWEEYHEKYGPSVLSFESWHDKYDKDMREFEEWRRIHQEEIQEWQRKHAETIEAWHNLHGKQLSELGQKRCCHGCPPAPASFPSTPSAIQSGAQVDRGMALGASTDAKPKASENSGHVTDAILEASLSDTRGEGADVVADDSMASGTADSYRCPCGAISGDGSEPTTETSTTRSTIQSAIDMLRSILKRGAATTSQNYQGELQPTVEAGTEANAEVAVADDSKTRKNATVNSIEPVPQIDNEAGENIGHSQNDFRSSSHPTHQSALPKELYDFLRPYFHSEPILVDNAPAASRNGGATVIGPTAITTTRDPEEFSAPGQEPSDLQEQYLFKAREPRGNEGNVSQMMAELLDKDREITAILEDKYKKENEFYEQVMAKDREIARLKEKYENTKEKLKKANADIIKLYREGLGLSTGVSAEESVASQQGDASSSKKAADDGSESDTDSVESVAIPRYSLMTEAAEHLRQTLEETKLQRAALSHEVGVLEIKRNQMLEDIANMEGRLVSSKYAQDHHLVGEPIGRGTRTHRTEVAPTDKNEDDEERIRSRPRGRGDGSSSTARAHSTVRQQRHRSAMGRRGLSQSRSHGGVQRTAHEERVPQLETDIKIRKDGGDCETLLSAKTLLTHETFEKIRSSRAIDKGADDEDESGEMWSLACDFKVRMVSAP
ncbi:hypothetical protein BX616_000968 [Lobosporangium transversale]|uniref:Uncharacterized protein n=1 Tax=Lobosporangium transversale TaxID=64571 RepID=A0A1Y2G5W2_9FUNG|nr:hypothetical protein BCR41DRAFT_426797 [Lobosporangium transversale]KAF9905631.1 hypothetical protein BX616_000968 [Lobosporangium transversale]ORY96037.1 hypothetical protein BCR41DRAFT_426797 [Lobosporangium transversale]|eukprot:XP_021875469.1 hypothetical protein BCR41DRAFT_426797 [Lobosporangium transversale]